MIKIYLIIGILFTHVTIAFSQTQILYVKPVQTDINYSAYEDSNYVVRNTSLNLNKLVLFIGGSYSSPKDYSIFCQYPATLGFDVISLKYPNNIATAPLGASSDSLVFNKYRQELCFGTPTSSAVAVDTLNSIFTRTLKLVKYLAVTYPSQNWGQYLATSTTLDWSKIIIAGHSQGSGHACYLAKNYPVDRVLLFSGPNDFSTFYSNSANWLRQPGVTPAIKHFALLHLQDEIVPFSNQFTNLTGLGMLNADDSTLVDNLSFPYSNSHFLYINTPAFSYHSAPIGGNSILPPVWNYMLTSSVATGIKEFNTGNSNLHIFPNPTSSNIVIEIPQNLTSETMYIFNSNGQIVLTDNIKGKKDVAINISLFTNGIYYIVIGNNKTKVLKY